MLDSFSKKKFLAINSALTSRALACVFASSAGPGRGPPSSVVWCRALVVGILKDFLWLAKACRFRVCILLSNFACLDRPVMVIQFGLRESADSSCPITRSSGTRAPSRSYSSRKVNDAFGASEAFFLAFRFLALRLFNSSYSASSCRRALSLPRRNSLNP